MESRRSSEDHNQRIQEHFGRAAQAYVASVGHSTGSDLERLVAVAAPTPSDVALDVATGGGHAALAITPWVGSITVTDLTDEMVQAARAHLTSKGVTNATYRQADSAALPFEPASFDLVVCRIAPHHFADVAAFVHEVARVLRRGGRFVVIDSLGDDDPELDAVLDTLERRRDPTHVCAHTMESWRTMIEAAGLTVTHVEIFRRLHEWQDWTRRSGMTTEARLALEGFLRDAQARFREKYEVVFGDDGGVVSWRDYKFLLRADKTRS
jgi:ubiquinone/menaquinone biosynthesis C-methylase UbiE